MNIQFLLRSCVAKAVCAVRLLAVRAEMKLSMKTEPNSTQAAVQQLRVLKLENQN